MARQNIYDDNEFFCIITMGQILQDAFKYFVYWSVLVGGIHEKDSVYNPYHLPFYRY